MQIYKTYAILETYSGKTSHFRHLVPPTLPREAGGNAAFFCAMPPGSDLLRGAAGLGGGRGRKGGIGEEAMAHSLWGSPPPRLLDSLSLVTFQMC